MLKNRKSSATASTKKHSEPEDRLLPRLTMFFFKRSGTAAIIWLIVAVFGIASYTTLLKREGFPSVNIPLVIVSGSYAVDDPKAVDGALAKTVSDVALEQPGASKVVTQSNANFFTATVQYEEDVDGNQAKKQLQKDIEAQNIPEGVELEYNAPYFGVTGGSVDKVDATVSVYDTSGKLSLQQLVDQASKASKELNTQKLNQIEGTKVANPFEEVTNPLTQQSASIQRSFDRFGIREDNSTDFYQSVIINVAGTEGFDAIKMDDALQQGVDKVNNSGDLGESKLAISASNAPTVKESISELQRVLLEGLLAVLIIGSIIIAIRASLIIVLAMITVLLTTLGVLFLAGYSLNVITLFGLILSLSLIVDDTIIMTEAIDAARRRNKKAKDAVEQATRKISRAMLAATLTAALSFVPLLFVGGILGSFIRAIPVTIISALLISLFVALIIIPLFAKYLLLGKKQMGEGSVKEVAAGLEEKIANFIAKPMLWARHSRKKEIITGLSAVAISIIFIMGGAMIFSKYVDFNIFPATKDTNQVAVAITYPTGTDIQAAENIADQADEITKNVIGQEFVKGTYFGMANDQSATLYVDLVPYGKRDIRAPELVDKLDASFKSFRGAKVDAYAVDVGPPTSAFTVNIDASKDREEAIRLANDMSAYLKGREIERPNGTTTKITDASVANTSSLNREDGKAVIKVNATFADTDTSTLTIVAQDTVKDKYKDSELEAYGLTQKDVSFDIGQESENQESFNTLAIAFPLVLLVIYLLLAIQFRSMFQPLIIFMAIPFSFFGIATGLAITDNAFSFFTMLGFFALIGLSIKNTILLTDYANQSQRDGMTPVDAAVEALRERFRPLIATSLTAVFSLIPLAITSPFWEALAVVLIFGLLSSTFLVITVFPYYYLGSEYLRGRINRRTGIAWLVLTIALVMLLSKAGPVAILAPFVAAALIVFGKRFARSRRT